jgi:hypothetical protein
MSVNSFEDGHWEHTAIKGRSRVFDIVHVFLTELLFVFQKT